MQKRVMQTRERAPAQHHRADGTDGFVVSDAHVTATRMFLDSHLGHDGNAHACPDHAENAAELAAFENDLRMESRTIAGCHSGITKAVTVAQKQEWLLAQILERERAAPAERMFPG